MTARIRISTQSTSTHDERCFWYSAGVFLCAKYRRRCHRVVERRLGLARNRRTACPDRSSNSVFFSSTSMSRLIIKNLPSNLTHERLRKHFEQQGAPPGTITDIKIARKPDGTSRRFAFVGYKTDKEAAAARDWFDRTFINSARLSVTVIEVRTMHSSWRRSHNSNRAPRTHQRLVQINGADSPTRTTVAASRQDPLHWMSLQRKPSNGLRVSSFVIWPFHVLTTISSPSFDHLEKLCR